MPADVIAFYGLLVVWAALLVLAVRRKRFEAFLAFGLGLMVLLNLRYFLTGQPAGIRFFIGLYDTFDNLGLRRGQGAPALAPCDGNACTVWDARYTYHPSWGVAFYDRFVDPPVLRKALLYVHIAFNSAALLFMHVQLARPGLGERRRRHVVLGRVTFGVLTIGTVAAVVLASEHGAVPDYGGLWAETGFYSMSAVVYGTAVLGVLAARRGDAATHRVWMIRSLGALWGAFWLFRVMLVVTGPLLRGHNTASLLLSIWLSAPLGALVADRAAHALAARRAAVPGTDQETVRPAR
ncbi:MAG: DUF2306 domain-containing protein [Actinobacteria bacterium]|nr:DUF2306 domain-containing protein [Actinomycetota bacterium]